MLFTTAVLAIALELLTPGAWAAQPGTAPGDDRIRVSVERWMSQHQLPGITVTVHQGQVTLHGTVLNAWARRQAAEHTRHVEGVKAVTCELVVRPGAGDAAIATEVERRVRDYAFYTIYENVDVAVKHGRVTLTGAVESEAERHAADIIARGVCGVLSVDNRLTTRPAR